MYPLTIIPWSLNHCSSLYCGFPQVRLQLLDGVLREPARMIGCVPKFGHISEFMRDTLHWLHVCMYACIYQVDLCMYLSEHLHSIIVQPPKITGHTQDQAWTWYWNFRRSHMGLPQGQFTARLFRSIPLNRVITYKVHPRTQTTVAPTVTSQT